MRHPPPPALGRLLVSLPPPFPLPTDPLSSPAEQGFDVDPIFSVQFSNHTGYPVFQGQVMNGDQLMEIASGLETNGLLTEYTHMLTGTRPDRGN